MPVRYRALRDACEVQGFERCLWGTGLFIFHVASLCRVIKCDKEVTFHVGRPCQEWEINKLIHGVFKFKWNLTYSRQVSRARPNDSVHKIHVGYIHSHTRSLLTGIGEQFQCKGHTVWQGHNDREAAKRSLGYDSSLSGRSTLKILMLIATCFTQSQQNFFLNVEFLM